MFQIKDNPTIILSRAEKDIINTFLNIDKIFPQEKLLKDMDTTKYKELYSKLIEIFQIFSKNNVNIKHEEYYDEYQKSHEESSAYDYKFKIEQIILSLYKLSRDLDNINQTRHNNICNEIKRFAEEFKTSNIDKIKRLSYIKQFQIHEETEKQLEEIFNNLKKGLFIENIVFEKNIDDKSGIKNGTLEVKNLQNNNSNTEKEKILNCLLDKKDVKIIPSLQGNNEKKQNNFKKTSAIIISVYLALLISGILLLPVCLPLAMVLISISGSLLATGAAIFINKSKENKAKIEDIEMIALSESKESKKSKEYINLYLNSNKKK